VGGGPSIYYDLWQGIRVFMYPIVPGAAPNPSPSQGPVLLSLAVEDFGAEVAATSKYLRGVTLKNNVGMTCWIKTVDRAKQSQTQPVAARKKTSWFKEHGRQPFCHNSQQTSTDDLGANRSPGDPISFSRMGPETKTIDCNFEWRSP